MITKLKKWIAPPVFADDKDNRTAYLLNIISISYVIVLTVLVILGVFQEGIPTVNRGLYFVLGNRVLPLVLAFISAQFLMRRGNNIHRAASIYIVILWLSAAANTWQYGGIQASSLSNFILLVIMAGLLLGNRGAIITAATGVLFNLLVLILQSQGFIAALEIPNSERFIGITLNLTLSAIYLSLFVRSLDEALENAETANNLLSQSRDTLERRVTERTQDLKLAAEIGSQVAQARNIEAVLSEATTAIKDQFSLYQVQIYLTDATRENLVLRASDGFAGSRLLETGHTLSIDQQSLNGEAAYNKQAVLVADTQKSDRFRPHPLLPDTRSEMVVPLLIEDDVLGVIDLQSTEANSLTEDVLPAFTVLAGQLAISIVNARQNRTMQENQRLLRTIINTTPDWIFVKDRQHRYQLVNRAYANAFDMSPALFIGKDDLELGFPEFVVNGDPEKGIPGFKPIDQAIMDSGKVRELPEEVIAINNNPKVFQTIKAPLVNTNGDVTGLVGFAHDITNRKVAEGTIARRAEELQAVAELSTAVSTIADSQQLLQAVVDLTKQRFNLYHAHIYLLDDSRQNLVLSAGSGMAGRMMATEGLSIPLSQEQSLVARAVRARKGIIVNDVATDPGFLPNPLLPETRSEMAIPIIIGSDLLGVLDVQSDSIDRFSNQDIQIQTTLASQTAVALQNARQFEQTQQALADATMFRQLADASSQGIAITTLVGQTLYVNDALTRILHIEDAEAVLHSDKTLVVHYPEAMRVKMDEEIVPTVLSEGSWQGEMRLGDPVNPTITYENHFLLRDAEGNPTHAAAVVSDITDQKEAEYSIRANETLMRTIIDATPDWIVVKDLDYRFLLVNESYARFKQLPVDEIIGKNDIEIGEDEDTARNQFWPEDDAIIQSGEMQVTEADVFEAADNSFHTKTFTKTPFKDTDGNNAGLVIYAHDITDQRKAQKEQERLAREFEDQLAQVNALQRVMTRDNWASYIEAQQKDETGFAFTGESLEPFDSNSLKALTGGLPVDPETLSQIAYDESQTAVLLPLQLHNESIGMVGARNANGDPINAEQHALLTTLTAQVAETLDRARLFEETETARSQTEALFSGSEKVVRSTSMEAILKALVEATALQNMERASILFFDEPWKTTPPEMLIVGATWRQDNEPSPIAVGTKFPFGIYPAVNVLERERPFVITDIETESRLDEDTRIQLRDGLNTRSVIFVPLVVGSQWLGFVVGLSLKPYHISDNDIRQITSLAGQAATVAQSQRLYQEASSRAEREQILRQISDRVYAAPDAETVLRTAAREIGQALGLETFIYLEDHEDTEEMVQANENSA